MVKQYKAGIHCINMRAQIEILDRRLSRMSLLGLPWSTRAEGIGCLLVGALVFSVIALILGRDINFDALNYHLYLGATVFDSRLEKDFFPANVVGFLSPFAYWPLGLMVKFGWPTWAVLVCLAAIQSFAAFSLWMVARYLFEKNDWHHFFKRLLSVGLGLSAPTVISQIGSSFIDLSTASLWMMGLGLVLWSRKQWISAQASALAAAVLVGLSVAFKLTNAPMGVLVGLMVFFSPGALKGRLVCAATFSVVSLTAFFAVYFPWGIKLWELYGNPIFPFANAIFKSAYFPDASLSHVRFLPQNIEDFVFRPLAMVEPLPLVYHEISSPDVRPLWYFGGLALVAVLWMVRRDVDSVGRRMLPLLLFMSSSWVAWLLLSGNGRYFVGGLALLGPSTMAVFSCSTIPRIVRHTSILSVTLMQVGMLFGNASFRWVSEDATEFWRSYFSVQLSDAIKEAPATFITTGTQSQSYLALDAHPDSTWMNLIGMFVLSPEGQAGKKVSEILGSGRNIYVVIPSAVELDRSSWKRNPVPPNWKAMQGLMKPYGVDVTGRCRFEIGSDDAFKILADTRPVPENKVMPSAGFWFCQASYSEQLKIEDAEEKLKDPRRKMIEAAFDRLEKSCPVIFRPAGVTTTIYNSGRAGRSYFSTDVSLTVKGDGMVSYRFFGPYKQYNVGMLEDVAAGNFNVECGELDRFYKMPWRRD